MASNPPGKCCTIGVKHQGEAKGKIETINGSMSHKKNYPKKLTT